MPISSSSERVSCSVPVSIVIASVSITNPNECPQKAQTNWPQLPDRTGHDGEVLTDAVNHVRSELATMADNGLLQAASPPEVRPVDISYLEQCEVVIRTAQNDASAAWVLMVHYQASAYARFLSPAAANKVCSGVLAAAGTAVATAIPRAGGGWRLSGEWPLASGIWYADHMLTQFDSPNGRYVAFVPTCQLGIPQDWAAAGLWATGSVTVTAAAVDLAPELCAPVDSEELLTYDLPIRRLGPGLVVCGAASAAVDAIAGHASEPLPGQRRLISGAALERLGRCYAENCAARAWLYEVARRASREVSEAEQSLCEANAYRAAVAATLTVVQLAGTEALDPRSRFTQTHADVVAAGAHAALQPGQYSDAFRRLLADAREDPQP